MTWSRAMCRVSILLWFGLGACGIEAVADDAGPASRTVNILFFTADDLHAESVGVFAGRPPGLTPHLDRFAGQGMRFDRAHVNAAICAPSAW